MKIQFSKQFTKILAFLTAFFAMQTAIAVDGPYELTQKVAGKFFTDLKTYDKKIKASPNMLKELVGEHLMPYVHVNYAGSLILGKYFRTTTAEQRQKFFTVLEKFIEQSYAQMFTLYTGQKVQVLPAQFHTDTQASVNVRLEQAQPINLTFHWRKNSRTGQWQAYDMVAEGASMIQTKQQEWGSILRKKGIEFLTEQVRTAAAAPVVFKK